MWMLAMILLALVLLKRTGGLLESGVCSICLFVTLFYLLSLAGVGFVFNAAADIAGLFVIGALCCTLVLRFITSQPRGKRLPSAGVVAAAALPLALFVWLVVLHGQAQLLPRLDPVAVPVFSKLLYAARGIPATLEPLSGGVFSYPPGYSVLLAPLHGLLQPLAILAVYKYLNLLTVALTPLVWALAFRSMLGLSRVGILTLVASWYAGFVLLDRSLYLGFHLAGKNAQLLCSLLFPVVLLGFTRKIKDGADFALRALVAAGLILIHYSAFYMLALALLGYYAIRLRTRIVAALRAAAAFGVAAVLVAPQVLTVGKSGIEFSGNEAAFSPSLLSALLRGVWLEHLKRFWFSRSGNFFFIFEDLGLRWPYKGMVLILGTGAAILLLRRFSTAADRQRSASRPGLLQGLLFLALTVLGSSVLASGVIPRSGINFDYLRWFVFNFSAALFGLSLVSFCLALPLAIRRSRTAAWCAGTAIALFGWWWLTPDLQFSREFAKERGSPSQLERFQAEVSVLSGEGSCSLFVQNTSGRIFFVVQPLKELDYLSLFSGCVIQSGTWLVPPLPQSTESDGFPSEALLEDRLRRGERVFVMGSTDDLDSYALALKRHRLLPAPGSIGGLEVRPVGPAG